MNRIVDRWLLRPEPNAAANAGIFRIVYALFYLWQIHDYLPGIVHDIPPEFHGHMLLTLWLPANPPVLVMNLLAAALVAGLVFLVAGYQTRLATGWVLVAGLLFEASFSNVDLERATIFLVAFIPFLMLISGDWGATYSVDALLRRRSGLAPVDPGDSSMRFVLPGHATLVILAILFCHSGMLKVIHYSAGFGQDHYMARLFFKNQIRAAVAGIAPVPLANFLYEHPVIDVVARWVVITFEVTFPLSLISARFRSFYVATALLFHSVNAIWLSVTFTAVMVIYAAFIDWETLVKRARPARPVLPAIPTRVLTLGVAALAVAWTAAWIYTRIPQQIVSLGDRVDGRTIWFPILPIAVLWTLYAAWSVLDSARSRA